MSLLRFYNPAFIRIALVALSIAVSLATGQQIALADDDAGG